MFNSFSKQGFPNTDWVDFSKNSTIVGWNRSASFTLILLYKIVDNVLYVIYRIEGTSNSTATSFTIPLDAIREYEKVSSGIQYITGGSNLHGVRYSCVAVDNGVTRDGYVYVSKTPVPFFFGGDCRGGIFVEARSSINTYLSWTGTGSKQINGQFFMPI
jgi:hypothetical protein